MMMKEKIGDKLKPKNIENPVFIMDRGYPSAELMDAIVSAGHKFIMCYSSEFLKSVKMQGDDMVVDHKFTKQITL